jgi:hypothetical protein
MSGDAQFEGLLAYLSRSREVLMKPVVPSELERVLRDVARVERSDARS